MNYRLRTVLTSLALTTFTATTAALATAQEAALIVGTAIGLPGHRVSIDVYLYTGGFEVAGTQNDIGFSPEAAIAAGENGQPLCTVNPAIRKNATAFSFPPPGCPFSGTPCTTVRALVLAFDNSTPIPDGSPLYTCQVGIAPDATPGVYAFDCSNSGSGNPEGNGPPDHVSRWKSNRGRG